MVTSIPALTAGRLTRPDGAVIHYETGGEGPAVVFAHGLGGNHLSWWQSAPVFAERHRVVAFSHRGFWPSTVASGVPDPQLYAGDVVALLDQLGIDKAVIVGQSMGGWTCAETALAAPDRVAGLVMACTSGSFDYDHFGDEGVAAWRKAAPAAIDALAKRGIHRAAGARMAEEQPGLHALYQAVDRLSLGLDKVEIGNRIRAMRTRRPEDAARITCPVLFVSGEEDLLICPRGVELVAGTFPKGRFVRVPVSGHSVYFERAAIFNALVDGFLGEIGWR
ncbi:alpha/beta fold hydrolase [Phreatobacter oligotrophus]|jgi:3-oxoadipate enol-lactonase|uniref:3-oxoadipate enol-lactonase n=1 Tax=Phreatobacter oligotrophus TaxID=1122261 RepID=A0A2T4Z5H0_9HYPH|nr:alpha/beta hydrolase [Phreatobacter oligotrophus]PTM57139.1 3-oxoadipate enol-lactonase [Phreatobacter oligotrophus]